MLDFAERVELSSKPAYLHMQSASALEVQAPTTVNECSVQLITHHSLVPLVMPKDIHIRLSDITQYIW